MNAGSNGVHAVTKKGVRAAWRLQAVPARITGTGMHVPEQVLSSTVLERRFQLAPGTIEASLGVRERRIAPLAHAVSDLAVPAAQAALADAGRTASEIGLTILATSTPDHPVPATAPAVASRLGVPGPAFDLMNTCSGWLYALATAQAHLQAGTAKAALVIGANVLSRRIDWTRDWGTAGLFGDGAGAIVLEAEATDSTDDFGQESTLSIIPGQNIPGTSLPGTRLAGTSMPGTILATALDADGSGPQAIRVPAGGSRAPISLEAVTAGEHLLRIERHPGMLRDSVAMLRHTALTALDRAGLAAGDVDWFLPHQASSRLVAEASLALGIPANRTLGHLDRYGNMSAASLPVLLHEAAASTLRRGDLVLMAAVAAGRTSGAAVVRW